MILMCISEQNKESYFPCRKPQKSTKKDVKGLFSLKYWYIDSFNTIFETWQKCLKYFFQSKPSTCLKEHKILTYTHIVPLVQFSRSVVSNSLWPHGLQHIGLPVHQQLPELAQTHVHQVGDAIQPSHPLSSPSPAFDLAQHQCLFKWVSSLHEVAKGLKFQLQHQSFQWNSRLISFRMDWLDLLAVQGTLKSLLQHHSSKASILQCLDFFIVQLSHPYTTTGKKHGFDQMDLSWQSNVFAF